MTFEISKNVFFNEKLSIMQKHWKRPEKDEKARIMMSDFTSFDDADWIEGKENSINPDNVFERGIKWFKKLVKIAK